MFDTLTLFTERDLRCSTPFNFRLSVIPRNFTCLAIEVSTPSITKRSKFSKFFLRFENKMNLDLRGERSRPLELRNLWIESKEKEGEFLATEEVSFEKNGQYRRYIVKCESLCVNNDLCFLGRYWIKVQFHVLLKQAIEATDLSLVYQRL